MKMTTVTKLLFKASGIIALGLTVINTAIYWYYIGYGFSLSIIYLGLPVMLFTCLALAICGFVAHFTGHRGAVISVIVLVVFHLIALLYFLIGLYSWSEGTEYARSFVVHLTFVTAVLFLWVLRPLVKSTVVQ